MTYEQEPTRVIVGAPGDLSTVTLAQGTRRAPGPGEVEIAVAAAATVARTRIGSGSTGVSRLAKATSVGGDLTVLLG